MTKYNMNITNAHNMSQERIPSSSNMSEQNSYKNSSIKKPNEQAGFHFSSSLKITDPNTKQVILQIRAD